MTGFRYRAKLCSTTRSNRSPRCLGQKGTLISLSSGSTIASGPRSGRRPEAGATTGSHFPAKPYSTTRSNRSQWCLGQKATLISLSSVSTIASGPPSGPRPEDGVTIGSHFPDKLFLFCFFFSFDAAVVLLFFFFFF